MKKSKATKKKFPSLSVSSPNRNLASTKVLREVGIKDLENYIKKLGANIKVFEEAIKKEKLEMKRAKGMVNALKTDIKTIDQIQKWHKLNN